MKIHDYFTTVHGEIIRLIEYQNKFERMYNGWPAFIETVTGKGTQREGFTTFSDALKRFSLERFRHHVREERLRLRNLHILKSVEQDTEFSDIAIFLTNISEEIFF